MKSILITSRDPCLKFSNPTGPGKSIQLIIPLIETKYNIYLLSTEDKSKFFYFYDREKKIFIKKKLFLVLRKKFDIIYINGIFSILYCFLPLLFKSKFFVSPRGMLGDESFEFKTIRKKFYVFFLRILILYKKANFISSSDKETQEIKVFLKKLSRNDIIQIPNLTGLKEYNNQEILINKSELKTKKKFKFITPSTISRKKNLLKTIRALNNLKDKIDFDYDIYGSVNDISYYNEIQKYLSKNKLDNISIKSTLPNQKLVDKLKNYDAMLLFTKGENFGHVIPESAKSLLPFLISNKTPWNYFDKYYFGVICDEELPISIENCIHNFTKLNNLELINLKKSIQKFYNNIVDMEYENIEKFKFIFK